MGWRTLSAAAAFSLACQQSAAEFIEQEATFWDAHWWWLREIMFAGGLLSTLAAIIFGSFAGPEPERHHNKEDDEPVARPPVRARTEPRVPLDHLSLRCEKQVAIASPTQEMGAEDVQLNGQLDYDQVARPLLNLDPAAAGEILRRLEEHAKEVRDPNGYVLSAAQRAGGKGGGKGPPRLKVPPLAPRAPPSAEDEKIARRVSWLNQHIKLPAPLDFDRLASSFRKIGYYPSLEVLNNLEEHADTVRDPTAYVIAGIRKVADGEGAGAQRL
ncbi:unnamed protein product [Effrenium voratum]|nr:unnamed protein product [Effrenium voratum]